MTEHDMVLPNPFNRPRDAGNNLYWLWYLVYVALIVLVAWGALLLLTRTQVIGKGTWLYDHTTWVPGLGQHSWARQPSAENGAVAGH